MRALRVDAVTGVISTVAGTGASDASRGDGGPATSATLLMPEWVAVAANDNLIVSEHGGNRIRRIYLPSPYLYSATGLAASVNGQAVTLTATVAPIGPGRDSDRYGAILRCLPDLTRLRGAHRRRRVVGDQRHESRRAFGDCVL
jgi:hypothetical protein